MAGEIQPWPAPASPGPLAAHVHLPGSKSQTNRALILGATSESPLSIKGPLTSRDTVLAARALTQLGVRYSSPSPDVLVVHGPERFELSGTIDCGLAGTVMRFVPALATFGSGRVTFDGDEAARTRPLQDLLHALTQLGATIEFHGEPGMLPFTLCGRNPDAGQFPVGVTLDSSATSQYLSALLLAAPAGPQSFSINLVAAVPSAAHVEMTTRMLEDQGVETVRTSDDIYLASSRRPAGKPVTIEPDLSNAGPFLAAALICGGEVRLADWPSETDQAGADWAEILPRFGAEVFVHGEDLVVRGPERPWGGIDLDLSRIGELTPTVAALCVLATGPSTLRGIAHLRGHETDRLAALVTEIRRCGADAEETPDGLIITPGKLRPADFKAYADHRMATFGALLGLAIPGCTVDDIHCTDKTVPNFPERWHALLVGTPGPALPSLAEELGVGENGE